MRFGDIDTQIEALLGDPDVVDRETGEISEAGSIALAEMEGERSATALYLSRVALAKQAMGEARRARAKQLISQAEVEERGAAGILKWVRQNVDEGVKLSDDQTQISWRKGSAVKVHESMTPERCPKEYLLDPKPPGISKKKVEAALKEGKELGWAEIVKTLHMQVK